MKSGSGIRACVRRYASMTGCSLAEADKAMRTAVEVIESELIDKGGVSFIGSLSLEVVERKAKRGINPSTRTPHIIPAHKTLKVIVGKQLKEKLNSK